MMPVFFRELKNKKLSIILWTAGMAAMLLVTVLLFPLIEPFMNTSAELYESLGIPMEEFTIDFQTYIFAECAELIALGGAIFAGIMAASALSSEERSHTADFLLSHPVSRVRVALEKYFSIVASLFIFSLITLLATYCSVLIIGETINFGALALLFFGCFVLEVVIASVSFLFSALVRANGIGFGIGFGLLGYVVLMVASFGQGADGKVGKLLSVLNYCTPYSMVYSLETADGGVSLDWKYWIAWPVIAIASVVIATLVYRKKDIYS